MNKVKSNKLRYMIIVPDEVSPWYYTVSSLKHNTRVSYGDSYLDSNDNPVFEYKGSGKVKLSNMTDCLNADLTYYCVTEEIKHV